MVDRRRLNRASRRFLGAAAALWIVASLTFFAVRLAPGDPARSTDPSVPAHHTDSLRSLYGLDRPLASQYGAWMNGLLRAELGWSFHYRRPVADVIADALWPTVGLSGLALTLQYVGALALAVFVAGRSAARHGVDAFATLFYAAPTFWLALLALGVAGRRRRK